MVDGICGSRQGSGTGVWQGWTLQEWTIRHHVAEVDLAGMDKSAKSSTLSQCRDLRMGEKTVRYQQDSSESVRSDLFEA